MKVIHYNDTFLRIFQVANTELPSINVTDLVVESDVNTLVSALSSGMLKQTIEVTCKRKSGTFPAEVHFKQLLSRQMLVWKDLSLQKQSEIYFIY